MEISNKYVSNYQVQNNIDPDGDNGSKEVNVAEYFNNKYSMSPSPGIDIKMGSTFINTKGKVTLCLSPDLVKKSMTDPKAAEIIKHGIDCMKGVEQFVKTHSLPDGTKAKSVSFTVDAQGNIEVNIEWEKPKEKKNDESEKKAKEKSKEKLKYKKKNLDKLKERGKLSNNPYDNSVYKNMVYRDNTADVSNQFLNNITSMFEE